MSHEMWTNIGIMSITLSLVGFVLFMCSTRNARSSMVPGYILVLLGFIGSVLTFLFS